MPVLLFSAPHLAALHHVCCLILTIIIFCSLTSNISAQVTLLVPSQPSIEFLPPVPEKNTEKRKVTHTKKDNESQKILDKEPAAAIPKAPSASIAQEVDVLITMMYPFRHLGLPMDMPQLFAVLRYDETTPTRNDILQPERRDLLGDIEEIHYLGQKAWGANVALDRPGLHHFIIEARPWWDAARQRFIQHYVKAIVPVYGVEHGWNLPAGLRLEILPLSRPFGLTAPAIFSGRAVRNGVPMTDISIRMLRINTDKHIAPTPWHQELAARADSNGQFSFVLNRPGWWCCQASTEGVPLKGPDGQLKPLELSALFWLYVDAPQTDEKR